MTGDTPDEDTRTDGVSPPNRSRSMPSAATAASAASASAPSASHLVTTTISGHATFRAVAAASTVCARTPSSAETTSKTTSRNVTMKSCVLQVRDRCRASRTSKSQS